MRFTYVVAVLSSLLCTGCVTKEIFNTSFSSLESCLKCSSKIRTVFLVSSQGSQPGKGGSQFTDYVMYGKYKGRAIFLNEPLFSEWMGTPSSKRLRHIAEDIAAAIGNNERDVDVWAFSLGANSMAYIEPLVKQIVGSTERMHVILIDPMIIDDAAGHSIEWMFAAAGIRMGTYLRESEVYIKNHPNWINLSGGYVINMDFNLDPVTFFTKLFNADRHYPWSGESELQRKVIAYLDKRFEAALRECRCSN
jgi:hypothetical protein